MAVEIFDVFIGIIVTSHWTPRYNTRKFGIELLGITSCTQSYNVVYFYGKSFCYCPKVHEGILLYHRMLFKLVVQLCICLT